MARGWIQGFPKKLGEVWMTRTLRARLRRPRRRSPPARAFGATCSARGRELLARDSSRSSSESESGSVHTDPPIVNVRHFPRLAAGRPRRARRSTSSSARAAATAPSRRSGRATPTLELFAAPGEEHTLLAP